MKSSLFLVLPVIVLTLFASCKKDDDIPPPPNTQDSCRYVYQNVDQQLDTCYSAINLANFTQFLPYDEFNSPPQDIVAAADGSFLLNASNSLHRSTNQGGTWQQVMTFPFSTSARNVDISTSGEVFMGLRRDKLYYSNNHGASFTALAAIGLPIHRDYLGINISVAPNSDIYVYLGWGNAADADSLFRSTDGGATFASVPLPSPGGYEMVQNITIDHTPSGRLFLTNKSGVFWSDDNGQNWTQSFQASWISGQIASTFITQDGRIFCTVGNQTQLSLDNGDNFQSLPTRIWAIYGTLPNGSLLASVAYQNEYVVISSDNGSTWGEMGSIYANPSLIGVNENGAVAFVGTNQVNWDINQTFWTCRNLPDVPSLGAWKDMDIEGATMALVAGRYTFVSTNRGYTWAIGAKLPWDATCVDYEPSVNKIMVGVGVSGGSPLDGNCYFLNSNGTSILGSISTGTGMNVHDLVFFNDNHWVVSLGWEPSSHGYMLATTDGGNSYLTALENVIGDLPRTLYYDPSHLLLYAATWGGLGWDEGWDYQRYDYDTLNGYEYDWADFRLEEHYANRAGCQSWARQSTGGKMFLSLHFNNVVQYNDQAHWMFKTMSLNLPEIAQKLSFDDLGYLWVLTENGLYRSNGIPAIQ